jgi:tetratricopeptide (TPR) repeat protein/tRNA A-37 threonylcarbamoyl transferase component Bud32
MENDARVDDLIDRWEEMHARGTPLTIEELCSDCPELVTEVRRRIAVLREVDSALETPVQDPRVTAGDRGRGGARADRTLPDVLRATAVYRPQRHHDHGGLGVVFTAHQEELDRLVALKRIRPDRLHHAARRRFLREAAILARLQHPGIVPIYGLGQDEGGPFYTMPFIQGQTLQEALEAFHRDESLGRDPGGRSLHFRGLLQRFIAACNTVAYAHDQGVVHRDLKPSNLMLGPYGETLVMDWGLAKRLGGDEPAAEAGGEDAAPSPSPSPSPAPGDVTAVGDILGTPQYMSPEQARGEPAGPAGDIFSLGLVLYAILTGKSAFDEARFRGEDRLKVVREAAVVPPCRRDPRVPRALEAVCLKALAARAEDRYPSARALADDLTRWLADEPVSAWREPVSIRARRWARHNRTAVTAAVVALVASVIGLGAMAGIQARANDRLKQAGDATLRALEETRKAQAKTQTALEETKASEQRAAAVSNFLVEAFRSPDPAQDGRQVKVAEVLDRAGVRLDQGFAGSQATKGALLDALGTTYLSLGLSDKAVGLLTKARDAREAAMGPDHPDTLASRNNLANAYKGAGRTSEAIAVHEAVLKLREARLGPDHPDTLSSRNNLAATYLAAGRTSDAIRMDEETLKSREAKLGPDHPNTLTSRSNLALAYRNAGRTSEAIALDEVTLKLREAKLGPDHPATLQSRLNLGAAYALAGRTTEAIALYKTTLRLQEARLGPNHPETLSSRANLAGAYYFAGRPVEAIALVEGTLKLREAELGPDHPDTLASRSNLAAAYAAVGRTTEAIALHEPVLKHHEAALGPDHTATLGSRTGLAATYRNAGRITEAIALMEKTLKLQEAKLGPDHPDTLMTGHHLADAYAVVGRLAEAIALEERTLKRMEINLGPDHFLTLESLIILASIYESLGRWAEAERLYREVLSRRRKAVKADSPLLAGDLVALGQNLLEQSRWSEAEELLHEALAIREKATPDDWARYDAMSLLGAALLGQGRHAEAEPLVVVGYEGMKAREARMPVPNRIRLPKAAGRIVRLYEEWNKPDRATEWKAKLGMPDLPAEVFARP